MTEAGQTYNKAQVFQTVFMNRDYSPGFDYFELETIKIFDSTYSECQNYRSIIVVADTLTDKSKQELDYPGRKNGGTH